MLKSLNLTVRFLAELVLIASGAVWGFTLDQPLIVRILLGLGAPAVVIAIWGRWIAPKSSRRLTNPARLIVEIVLFAAGTVAYWAAGWITFAIVFGVVVAVSLVIHRMTSPDS